MHSITRTAAALAMCHGRRIPHLLVSSFPQVNIIPIIAKADTISKSELHKFKIKIMSELVSNGVQIYQFPTDDEAVSEINASMNVSHILTLIGLIYAEHKKLQMRFCTCVCLLSK